MTITPIVLDTLHTQAENLANAMGIDVYIRDGAIYQHPPGERIPAPRNSVPTPMGSGMTIAAKEPV